MRLLIACPKCNRQYDASALVAGQRFRCHCGQIITVQQPQGHDATAICCSHCGAPRQEGALSCAYCGAEFTLHDRDLDTVCPHCFTRVGHADKFCHFCGAAINPEAVAGAPSNLTCPACGAGHQLTSRAWGDVTTMECQRCGGLWLGNETFKHLTEQAATQGDNVEDHAHPRTARSPQVDTAPPDGGHRYRPCAVCGQLMIKYQYGGTSGVIVDWCGRHGVWFDADELPRILDWVRAGGLAGDHEDDRQLQAEQELARRKAEAALLERGILPDPAAEVHNSPMFQLLSQLSRRLFHRY